MLVLLFNRLRPYNNIGFLLVITFASSSIVLFRLNSIIESVIKPYVVAIRKNEIVIATNNNKNSQHDEIVLFLDRTYQEYVEYYDRIFHTDDEEEYHHGRFIDCKIDMNDTFTPMSLNECLGLETNITTLYTPLLLSSPAGTSNVAKMGMGKSKSSTTNNSIGNITFHDIPELTDRLINHHDVRFQSIGRALEDGLDQKTTITNMLIRQQHHNHLPSIAIFYNAYIEMESGRVLLDYHQNNNNINNKNDNSILIQFHQCGTKYKQKMFHYNYYNNDDSSYSMTFDKAIVLTANWADSYFHATIEHFPRLAIMANYIKQHKDFIIVTQGTLLSTYAEQLLGIEKERFVIASNLDIIYVKKVLIPEPTPCGRIHPISASFTRKLIQDRLLLSPSEVITKTTVDNHDYDSSNKGIILLVRRRISRYLEKHNELEFALNQNFPNERIIVFDEDDLPAVGLEQWKLFYSAQLVIAPHGAALANLIAVKTNTAVIEFLGIGYDINICYMSLAVILGLEYHATAMTYQGNYTYTVDVNNVISIVSSIIANKQKK